MKLVTIETVAEMYSVTTRHLRTLWYNGDIPAPRRIGSRSVRWNLEEIENHIRSQRGEPAPKSEKEFA